MVVSFKIDVVKLIEQNKDHPLLRGGSVKDILDEVSTFDLNAIAKEQFEESFTDIFNY